MELKEFTYKIVPLRSKMLLYAMRFIKGCDDAEDIVQETLLKLWSMRERLDEYDSVEALSYRIIHNLSLDRIKSTKIYFDEDSLKTIPSAISDPMEQTELKDDVAQIRYLIASLPTLQQMIIRMKDIEGYEIDEIAAITGIQIEAARMNLSRARKKIREQFISIQNVKIKSEL